MSQWAGTRLWKMCPSAIGENMLERALRKVSNRDCGKCGILAKVSADPMGSPTTIGAWKYGLRKSDAARKQTAHWLTTRMSPPDLPFAHCFAHVAARFGHRWRPRGQTETHTARR